jgi:dolichol-phosphate mannosyltransferase
MALDSIISFSDLPLKMISLLGLFVALAGFLLILILIVSKLLFLDIPRGYTSTISVIVFLGGIQIMVTGFASLYIGRVLKEVQNRPLYIIRQKINF